MNKASLLFVVHFTFFLTGVCLPVFPQAKRPTLMVVPADSWCREHGFMTNTEPPHADYVRALTSDEDLLPVVAKIGELMAEQDFPLKDLGQQLRSGDSLLQRAQADIFLEVAWKLNKIGPKKSVTYTLRGLDAYTSKQVATASGTGKPSFAAELPVLLQEAVIEQMDAFQEQLLQHFEDLFENGREVRIAVEIASDADFTFDSEFDGDPLTDLLDDWMAQNAVGGRYSLSDAKERSLLFEQVRIPMIADNGMAVDARRFATQLRRDLQPLGLKARVTAEGLGYATVHLSK
ncbi:MAG: hypothetical protein J5545_09285 [Bacteroidaceae bacterium]|nr:hypothetical protein [Bacteroidaceae bacterium]